MFIPDRSRKIIDILAKGDMSLTQIQNALGVSKPMALKLMKDIVVKGMVTSHMRKTKSGREKIYKLAPFSFVISSDPGSGLVLSYHSGSPLDIEHPLVAQIEQQEYHGPIKEYLRAIEQRLKKQQYAVILFGSLVRGEATRKSDVDLVFISRKWSKKDKEQVRDALAGVVHKAGVQAVPHFWGPGDLTKGKDNLSRAVRDEGMLLFYKGEVVGIWQTLKRYKSISN